MVLHMAVNSETVRVYVPAADARALKEDGKVPAEWVRALVRHALAKRREERRV